MYRHKCIVLSNKGSRSFAEKRETHRWNSVVVGAINVTESTLSVGGDEPALRSNILHTEFDKQILDLLPQMIWSTNARGEPDFFNRRWYEFTGVPVGATYGENWSLVLHPDDAARANRYWQQCVDSGSDYEIEYRIRGSKGDFRWVLARGVPARGADGSITRWFGTCTDIDDRKRAESQRELISEELGHRIKNIFSVIKSLVTISGTQTSIAELGGRIEALGKANQYILPGAKDAAQRGGATLLGLMADLFDPYRIDGAQRIILRGDDVEIGRHTATSLALLLHELATNAIKYGSLQKRDGVVTVTITPAEETVGFEWCESGGVDVNPPGEAAGFGTGLIDRVVRYQLGTTLDRQWHPQGLLACMTMPRDRLRR